MYRTHTCGELRITDSNKKVTLVGWIQTIRKFGSITFIDLRDRYGITQLVITETQSIQQLPSGIGREYVVEVNGIVRERSNKNYNITTGEVEIETIKIINATLNPPFTIEEQTDGGEEIRMKYRYLDLRRPTLKRNMELRYKVNRAVCHHMGVLLLVLTDYVH